VGVSYSFYVPAAVPVRFSALVAAVAEPAWACSEEAPEDDQFRDGFFFHPYVRGRSARGVEIGLQDDRYQVRIMTSSSRADYVLGLRAVDAFARLTGARVEPEDGEPMSRQELRDAYGSDWVERMYLWGLRTALELVDRERQTLTMHGARRPFYLGPRFAAELRAAAGSVEERLSAAMVALQNIDEDRYFEASAMQLSPKQRASKAVPITLAAWASDVAYLFPDVQYFALKDEGGLFTVPASAGPKIAGRNWRYLDEKNALVEAIADADWPAVLARARSLAVDLPSS
jgi:hypothetical protein